ncbi:MAG: nucleotide-binding protein [Rheinheimera sp.]|nr:MAG: nucleotide-binding protein [Rheinheimera sp.]
MYAADLAFRVIGDTSYDAAEAAIRRYLEALIFQGQILGREFPTVLQQDNFVSRVLLPAPDALQMHHHSDSGRQALDALQQAGLSYPKTEIAGVDLMSNHTDPCKNADQFILYCRFAQMNSVLYCAEHFAPVPLYRFGTSAGFEDLIRWQLQYQALDEVQMQQNSVLLKPAERALQNFGSQLNRQGRAFARGISQRIAKPVYYALYRGSSTDCEAETQRRCPGCGGDWLLSEPWHQHFDFRCDRCLLVSNIAWQCQG